MGGSPNSPCRKSFLSIFPSIEEPWFELSGRCSLPEHRACSPLVQQPLPRKEWPGRCSGLTLVDMPFNGPSRLTLSLDDFRTRSGKNGEYGPNREGFQAPSLLRRSQTAVKRRSVRLGQNGLLGMMPVRNAQAGTKPLKCVTKGYRTLPSCSFVQGATSPGETSCVLVKGREWWRACSLPATRPPLPSTCVIH